MPFKNKEEQKKYMKNYMKKLKNKVKRREYISKWRKGNLEKERKYKYQRMYKINLKQYGEMLRKQNYQCAICKKSQQKKFLNVDHNHKTKKVRGLLCHNCNIGLGNFKEDIEILSEVIKYLKK